MGLFGLFKKNKIRSNKEEKIAQSNETGYDKINSDFKEKLIKLLAEEKIRFFGDVVVKDTNKIYRLPFYQTRKGETQLDSSTFPDITGGFILLQELIHKLKSIKSSSDEKYAYRLQIPFEYEHKSKPISPKSKKYNEFQKKFLEREKEIAKIKMEAKHKGKITNYKLINGSWIKVEQ